jgi:uncharacterized membrane-anchored protein YjiN (DUF445 family)
VTTTGTVPGPVVSTVGGAADEQRRRDLRRMKAVATGLIVAAAVVYVLAARWERADGPEWVGYLAAAAEAAMIGGLADWFAVTALFSHPLRLPIPHTAIIPRKKDQLGASLSTFVGENFLQETSVRARIDTVDVAVRLGAWLAVPANAARVSDEVAAWARGGLRVLSDHDVRATVEFAVMRKLATMDVSQPLGTLLAQIVRDGAHRGLVDVIVDRTWLWLRDNKPTVLTTLAGQAPGWSPRFVDDLVAERIYGEIMRVATEVREQPDHDIRGTLDRLLVNLAHDLQHDVSTIHRVERTRDELLTHPEARRLLDYLWTSAQQSLAEMVDDPASGLRTQISDQLRKLGSSLQEDAELSAKVNRWVADAVVHVVTSYRDDVTAVISDTVRAWDAEDTSRRIELHVGRDLQFIRINGFVVGALVGVVIHGLTTAFL